jgi:NUDIX domain
VLREAEEETGLAALRIVRYLGEADYDMRPYTNAVHHRHFFHLAVDGPFPMSGATSNNTAEPNNRRHSGSSGSLSTGWPTTSPMSSG